MGQALRLCLLCVALSIFSGASCGKKASVKNANSGARSSNVETADDPFAKIPRMTVRELKKALDEGRAVAADVRPAEAFEEEHIEGALSVPEDDWAAHAGDVPKDKLVVAYCA